MAFPSLELSRQAAEMFGNSYISRIYYSGDHYKTFELLYGEE